MDPNTNLLNSVIITFNHIYFFDNFINAERDEYGYCYYENVLHPIWYLLIHIQRIPMIQEELNSSVSKVLILLLCVVASFVFEHECCADDGAGL